MHSSPLVFLTLLITPALAWGQVVRIENGSIRGALQGDVAVYRSIPYAAPPTGPLRWKEPQPPLRWDGVRTAETFGPICMQAGASVPGAPTEPVSEDCLTLSIWAPSDGSKLPVMVWIPGGGFTQASGSMPLYWGDTLAKRGVIVVAVNYRVGIFGFLAHPQLTTESRHRSSGNYGLLDQIAALKWIKRNIAAFGGDPQRVTIWGQSAGSMSVSLLMSSPLARGLFHRAIGQSGAFFTPPLATSDPPGYRLKGAESSGLEFSAAAGATTIEALRQLPAPEILKRTGVGTTHPIIDGYVLPEEPFEIFSRRRQNDVPVLMGFNADEAKPLLAGRTIRAATFTEDISINFRSDPVRDIATAYVRRFPIANDAEARQKREALERDLRFGWDMWAWARLQSINGKGKVFFYYFRHTPPAPPNKSSPESGAGHWEELRYVFGQLDQESRAWSDRDYELARTMATYWTNFAKTGDPNGKEVPSWPNFSPNSGRVMDFGNETAVSSFPNLGSLQIFEDAYGELRKSKEVRK